MHDYIFFSGQIIFNESNQFQLAVKMDTGFQGFLIIGRQIGDRIGEDPNGFRLSVLPEGYHTVLYPQQKTKNRKTGHYMLYFYNYHLFGGSISVNLIFINKIGLSFSFGVCYNHMRSVMPIAQ